MQNMNFIFSKSKRTTKNKIANKNNDSKSKYCFSCYNFSRIFPIQIGLLNAKLGIV